MGNAFLLNSELDEAPILRLRIRCIFRSTTTVRATQTLQNVYDIRRAIVLPIAVFTALAILVACSGLYLNTRQADEVSTERQVRITEHAIDLSVDDLAKEQETVAAWDDLVKRLSNKKLDLTWLDDNVGFWLHNLFNHDRVFILDAHDQPIYGMASGKRVRPSDFYRFSRDVRLMVDSIRGRSGLTNGIHDRNPGKQLNPHSTVLTTSRVVHDSHMMEVEGRPAAVSVMAIVPLTRRIRQVRGQEPLLVSIRFLDGSFLRALSNRNLIADARFSPANDAGEGEYALALVTEHGKHIGNFIWRPELPGSHLLNHLLVQTGVTIALLIAGMAILGKGLIRSTRRIQRMHQRLQHAVVGLEASKAQAQHLAFHDALTGLPNRVLFNERLAQALATIRRGGTVAVIALDLDRFKQINDTLGHHAGDILIREFARRLSSVVREIDTVARQSGDEFALVLPNLSRQEVLKVCQRIIDSVRQPFDLSGAQAFVGASMGLAFAPSDSSDRTDLLRKADIALYRAKKDGRGCWREFTADMDNTVKLRRSIEEDLRVALKEGTGLCLHYQPQIEGDQKNVIGFEALIRWDHPTRGCMSPEQFIPIAEETGLICEVGEWLLIEACKTAANFPGRFMAVNLSPVQFRVPGFAERVIEIVSVSGVEPEQIELEVTENVLLDNDEQIVSSLNKLRNAGLRVALDDFGTGYSSLSYLRRFQVDKIKIDKSFIQYLGQNGDAAAIVTAIVTLGHAMGLSVTAEGVETAEQQDFLAANGCNVLQGFLYSRAVPAHRLPAMMQRPVSDWSEIQSVKAAEAA